MGLTISLDRLNSLVINKIVLIGKKITVSFFKLFL